MTVVAGDAILKYAALSSVVSGATPAVADGAFAIADVAGTAQWANTLDLAEASAVLSLQFATMPTYGTIGLFAHLVNVIPSTSPPEPSPDYRDGYVGAFRISSDSALAGTTHHLTIARLAIPSFVTGQRIDWWIENAGTAQSISAGWNLYIGPVTFGPKP